MHARTHARNHAMTTAIYQPQNYCLTHSLPLHTPDDDDDDEYDDDDD